MWGKKRGILLVIVLFIILISLISNVIFVAGFACNDGIDNDDDGKIDLADLGCINAQDNSEVDLLTECNDNLDNDNDGTIDMADPCCISDSTKPEAFCNIPTCTQTGQISSQVIECNCRNSATCKGGQFCCPAGCQNTPCGSDGCTTGARQSCGTTDINGCELFKYCKDGSWEANSQCKKDPTCGVPIELCDNGIDDNLNNKIDCLDIVCNDAVCNKDETTCKQKGYLNPDNNKWQCCFTGTTSDCYGNDGIKDTCGDCNCQIIMPKPYMSAVEPIIKENKIWVKWGINCNVPMYVYKCIKGETNCEMPENFNRISEQINNKWEYFDTDIDPKKEYCYLIQAEYQKGKVNSERLCTSTGDEACLEFTSSQFCLNETLGTSGVKVIRAQCSGGNVQVIENCQETNSERYICTGPFENELVKTRCEYQSECDTCGGALNMFANYITSRAIYVNARQPTEINCKNIPTCYYDYSDTTVDKFHDCSEISSCYDYRSEFACTGQPTSAANNKCLTRNCEWKQLGNDIDTGICFETTDYYKKCEYCNYAENNKIFDKCTTDKCQLFGDCFIRQFDEKCVDTNSISCLDYKTKTECTGNTELEVDTVYNKDNLRTSGTNEIKTKSADPAGIGLCKWQDENCFKDANGDLNPDNLPYDKTPPYSRMLNNKKVFTLNFTLELSDLNPDGSVGTGVTNTFICFDDARPCYPTENYIPQNNIVYAEYGGGHGVHDIYYYSVDGSDNLEVVKKATIEIDRSPPVITIDQFKYPDLTAFTNSKVVLSVKTDEDATCHDTFEDAKKNKITFDYGKNWVVAYEGLNDGYYAYTVNCSDDLGNTAVKTIDIRIDADSTIYDPKPSGKIDYKPVTLGVNTKDDVVCKFGQEEDTFDRLPNTFDKQKIDNHYYHYKTIDLTENGTYSFDVKCNLKTRISDDEIQFVYDKMAPVTKVLDMNGKLFDFTKWYTGLTEKIFLTCEDAPFNGFGCDKTKYCVSNKECEPNRVNDPLKPISYDSKNGQDWICYSSIDNKIGNYGGNIETKVCKQIKEDHLLPILTIHGIEHYDTQTNPYTTFDQTYLLRGSVNDPDAVSIQNNVVQISVLNDKGDEKKYTGIPANKEFSKLINLGQGVNVVTVTATDRSRKSVQKTVFIKVVEFTGNKIILTKPNKDGVSGSQKFDLEIKTYKDAECRFSINNAAYANSQIMDKYTEQGTDGEEFYHKKTNFELSGISEIKETVYIKCKDSINMLFNAEFELSWDNTPPVINDIYILNSNKQTPVTIVEPPLNTTVFVKTDDDVRCKYSEDNTNYGVSMIEFNNFKTQKLTSLNKQPFSNLSNPKKYSFYFQCENGAYVNNIQSLSEKKLFEFEVDTAKATGIKFLSPPLITPNATVELKIETTKKSTDCKYGTNSTPTTPMNMINDYQYSTGSITLSEGEHTIYIECKTFDKRISDYYTFIVDNTPPTKPIINDGNVTPHLIELSAKWESADNLSGIERYNYSIGTSPGKADILNWTITGSDQATAKNLNLTNFNTYYWNVKAQNKVGLWSGVGFSDGILVEQLGNDTPQLINDTPDPTLHHCSNNYADYDLGEMGVDCGSVCPNSCSQGTNCTLDEDCDSKICQEGVCISGSCEDNILNQDESGIDCGGVCPGCIASANCTYNSDCESKICGEDYTCVPGNCSDGVMNNDEEGEDCGGNCDSVCSESTGGIDTDGDGEPDKDCIARDQKLDTDCDGMPDWWENKYGLNMYSDDSDQDPDGDEYSNAEEFYNGTDPNVADKKETESNLLSWILLIVSLIFIIAGGSYVGYTEYQKKHNKKRHNKFSLDDQSMPPPIDSISEPPKERISVSGHNKNNLPPPPPHEKSPQEKYLESLKSLIRDKRKDVKLEKRNDMLSAFEKAEIESKKETTKSDTNDKLTKLIPIDKKSESANKGNSNNTLDNHINNNNTTANNNINRPKASSIVTASKLNSRKVADENSKNKINNNINKDNNINNKSKESSIPLSQEQKDALKALKNIVNSENDPFQKLDKITKSGKESNQTNSNNNSDNKLNNKNNKNSSVKNKNNSDNNQTKKTNKNKSKKTRKNKK